MAKRSLITFSRNLGAAIGDKAGLAIGKLVGPSMFTVNGDRYVNALGEGGMNVASTMQALLTIAQGYAGLAIYHLDLSNGVKYAGAAKATEIGVERVVLPIIGRRRSSQPVEQEHAE